MSVACVLFFFLQRFEIINPVRVRSTFARSSLQGVIAIGEGGVYVGREGSYGERERRIGMVKRRWMEGRGNSRGRRITCKHVSSLNIRSIGRGISNDVGGSCRSAVVP